MKRPWRDIEKQYYRIDIGSTRTQAMSSSAPETTLFLTTDGYICMNGVELGNAQMTSARITRTDHAVQDTGDSLSGVYVMGNSNTIIDATSSPDLIVSDAHKPNVIVSQNGDINTRVTLRNDGNYFFMILTESNGGYGARPFYIDLKQKVVHVTGYFHQVGTSDVRTKDNLNKDFSAVELLSRLGEVYEFDYNTKAGADSGRHSYGLLAQNVEQVAELADTVGEKYDGMKYINYIDPRFIALLIKSVGELARTVGLKE